MADASKADSPAPTKRARPDESSASGSTATAAAAAAAAAAPAATGAEAGSGAGAGASASAASGAKATTTLFSYWRSSCSWRVRIALELLGVPFEYAAVHLVRDGGEQLAPAFAAKNPMKEVPALEIDGLLLTQSLSIIEYLHETRGAKAASPLLPADPVARQQVRAISDIIAQGIQPVQNLRVLLRAMTLAPEDKKTQTKIAWGRHYITKGFEALELALVKSAGTFCVGDSVTMADLCLVPQVYNANRFGVDMSQFPTISRVEAKCATLDAFRRAHPDAQPDANK